MKNRRITTRFAPSPTGAFHVGSARTALFNFLFARQSGGSMILRIDDTDKDRSDKKYEQDILSGLDWLKISYDKLYHQSERTNIYHQALIKLLDEGSAFWSREANGQRQEVIRLKNPGQLIRFNDLIRGEISFQTNDLGDFVIAKDLNSPLYHLASVVDDGEMEVTHVIRGEDHISNTPRQILIAKALGYDLPDYAHIPLILAPDRSKLSKRHGATAVLDYQKLGYLPEALINFIVRLGWSHQAGQNQDPDQEIFSLSELIDRFDLSAIQKSPAIFDINKLNWFNQAYIKNSPTEVLTKAIKQTLPQISTDKANKIAPLVASKINTLKDIDKIITTGELAFLFNRPKINKVMLKNTDHFDKLIDLLSKLPEADFSNDKIKEAIWDYASQEGRGCVLWPMRVALTGLEKSPDPFSVASALGKNETLNRLSLAKQAK